MSLLFPPVPPQLLGAEFQVWWQQVAEAITGEFGALEEAVAANTAALAADTKARNRMDDLPNVIINGDYTGAVNADQLPLAIAAKRYDGTTDVSASSTWTATVESGDVTCSIDSATGILTVTDIGIDSVVRIESEKDGLTLRKKQVILVSLSAPPNTGGSGGTSWTDTTFSTINSTTMAAISDELTVTVGASGSVDLSAPLQFFVPSTAPSGIYNVFGIWQWWDGAAWTDLGTEVESSHPCVVGTDKTVVNGTLSVPSSKTGLVAGASEKFRLEARREFGTLVTSFTGTATATSS